MPGLRFASSTTMSRCGCVSQGVPSWGVVFALVMAGVLAIGSKPLLAQSKYGRFVIPRTEVGIANSTEQIWQLYFEHERWADASWLDRLDGARLAPLTRETQRWIHSQQNPSQNACHNATHLIMNHKDRGAGLGSVLHVGGWYLGYALEQNMLFRWEEQSGTQFVDDGCGRGLPFSNMECLFLSPSSCSAEHVTAANSKPLDYHQLNGLWNFRTTPSYLRRRLEETFAAQGVKLSDEFIAYWWRAQSAAYLARFNERTRSAVAAMRTKDNAMLATTRRPGQDRKNVKVGFPLPPGSISVHIREGLKAKEMKLWPFERYISMAEHFVNTNPLHVKKIMLLTADNPAVYAEAESMQRKKPGTSPDYSWVVMTANVSEPKDNGEWTAQIAQFGKQHFLTHLLKLLLALECDAWVTSRGSNWDRLIDELRCVWVAKCAYPFVEIGEEETNWRGYSWRRMRSL